MTDAAGSAAGFCGKLPARSDFVTRRVPLSFVEPWHDWLAAALSGMREALGEDWLDAYLYGPIWRFAVPSGVVGPTAMAGTLMPSVDAVGRYFPLTIATALPSVAALTAIVTLGAAWFAEIEALSLAALDGALDIDELSERLLALSPPPLSTSAMGHLQGPLSAPGLAIPCAEGDAVATTLATHAPAQLAAGNTAWWTDGSDSIAPVVLLARGLPAPRAFSTMFSGAWAAGGWRSEESPESSTALSWGDEARRST
jgi:type VI secretion system protein ImpM